MSKTNKSITNNSRILFYLTLTLFAYFNCSSIALTAQYQPPQTFSKDQYQFEPFLLPGGKLENIIQCMAQDSTGVLWIGTQNGLVKYDGRKFERFLHNPLDSNSLINNYVECIYVDTDGSLWIGSFSEGFTTFQPSTNQFQRYYLRGENGKKTPKIGVNTILRHQKYIWLGTHNGLFRFDQQSKQFKRYYFDPDYKEIFTANVVRALYVDRTDTFWMGMGFTWNPDSSNGGLFKYQPEVDNFIEYRHVKGNVNSLSDNRVKGILEDSKNNFWIGTMGDGLNKMDRTRNQFTSYPYQPNSREQLSRPLVQDVKYRDNLYNQVQFIHEDPDNRLWIGSFDNGLNIYDPNSAKQIHFERGVNGLETNNIWNIFEAKDHTIFICSGADGQGKNYQLQIKRNLFPFFAMSSNTRIKEITMDQDNQIWLGGNNDTNLWQFNPESKDLKIVSSKQKRELFAMELAAEAYFSGNLPVALFRAFDLLNIDKRFQNETLQKNNFTDFFLETAKKDKAGNIWIGTWGHGLFRINPYTKTIQSFKHDKTNASSIGGDHVSVIYEDKKGGLWMGGGKEAKNLDFPFFLDRYDAAADSFAHYYPTQIDYGYPTLIGEDKMGNLWYPTVLDGIHHLDIGTGKVTKYNQSNSLIPTDDIRALVIDEADNIWMTAEKSLIRFTLDRQSFIEYGAAQGIKTGKFEIGSGHISQNQTIYFGANNGFHFFDPQVVIQNDKLLIPSINITEFSVRNKKGGLFENKLLSASKKLDLTATENSFSIGFTVAEYQNPATVYLEYMLENYDPTWQKADDKKTASYYNLQPGTYLFQVRGTNSRGLWNKEGQQMSIIIHPPWWDTNWARLLFISLISGIIYGLYRFQLSRKLALQETKRLRELDETKTRLYTNITHEFRTPLTAILGMNNRLVSFFKNKNNPREQEALDSIQRNSHRLLGLINQILDLSKIESNAMSLKMEQGDIIIYINYLFQSFHSLAETKQIRIHISQEIESCIMDFDQEKIQIIISNLLSNAIKFTPAGGLINLHITQTKDNNLSLKINDSGSGISKTDLPFIFDRFYQIDSSSTRQGEGTGIGLALTKELVELMSGTISVYSSLGKGTTFTVLLPITQKAALIEKKKESESMTIAGKFLSTKPATLSSATKVNEQLKDRLLIIEDNTDVTLYLKDCLEESYQLYFAQNGQEGIDKAIELIPDIIISDVMMPEKDGFEVTQTLKNDERTSHIPIILLTAKADVASKIIGLERGADAYLVKPFQPKELQIRLEKMITLRRKLQAHYSSGKVFAFPKKQETTAPALILKNIQTENAFLLKINKILDKHLSEDHLDVAFLCQKLHMSQSQLYRKIKALTNKSIVAYLRTYRLHKAKVLLQNSNKSISDIAYEVGFLDPFYFSRLFSEEFGHPPSDVRK